MLGSSCSAFSCAGVTSAKFPIIPILLPPSPTPNACAQARVCARVACSALLGQPSRSTPSRLICYRRPQRRRPRVQKEPDKRKDRDHSSNERCLKESHKQRRVRKPQQSRGNLHQEQEYEHELSQYHDFPNPLIEESPVPSEPK